MAIEISMTVAAISPFVNLFSFIQKSLLPYRLFPSGFVQMAFDLVLLFTRTYKILFSERPSKLSGCSFLRKYWSTFTLISQESEQRSSSLIRTKSTAIRAVWISSLSSISWAPTASVGPIFWSRDSGSATPDIKSEHRSNLHCMQTAWLSIQTWSPPPISLRYFVLSERQPLRFTVGSA